MEENKKYLEDITNFYIETGSINKTALKFNISGGKVKKCLVTMGHYHSDTQEKIAELYKKNKTPKEIAEILDLSISTVNMYLPYEKAIYDCNPSMNAIKIRKSRKKWKVK